MRLVSRWRKISVSMTEGTTSLRSMAENTSPGPTAGSCAASPTNIRRAETGSAFSSACIRRMSTIEHSSMISASQRRGSSAFFVKTRSMLSSESFAPSMRWMVAASTPVSSVMRFAARPVGAASRVLRPSRS